MSSIKLPDQLKLVVQPPISAKGKKTVSSKVAQGSKICLGLDGVKLPQTLPCGGVRSDCASSSHPEEAGVMETAITQHASNEAITPQTDSCSGRIEADSYYITDANVGILGGEIAMNDTGNLSLRLNGEMFEKVHRRWITNQSKEKIGEVFSLQSTTNTQFYLALNVRSPQFCVEGMTLEDMGDTTNCYWTNIPFQDIAGRCPLRSNYFALQYRGNYFGTPSSDDSDDYFFVIENGPMFKIATVDVAVRYGCLGFAT